MLFLLFQFWGKAAKCPTNVGPSMLQSQDASELRKSVASLKIITFGYYTIHMLSFVLFFIFHSFANFYLIKINF